MKTVILAAAALAAASFANTGAWAEQKPTGDVKQKPTGEEHVVPIPPANWLFVQTADSMTFKGTTLTLNGVAPQTAICGRPRLASGF